MAKYLRRVTKAGRHDRHRDDQRVIRPRRAVSNIETRPTAHPHRIAFMYLTEVVIHPVARHGKVDRLKTGVLQGVTGESLLRPLIAKNAGC